jgi:nickel-dependent lactate racemase
VLESADSPQALLDLIENRPRTVPDQWQVQVQAKVQSRARVIMHTSYLSDHALRAAHLEQTPDIGATVRELLTAAGPDAQVCVLPEGPQTIPYVSAEAFADIR